MSVVVSCSHPNAPILADTFLEHSKHLIDVLHSRHSRDPRLQVTNYTQSIRAMHVYDSMVFLEKGATRGLVDVQRGDKWIPYV